MTICQIYFCHVLLTWSGTATLTLHHQILLRCTLIGNVISRRLYKSSDISAVLGGFSGVAQNKKKMTRVNILYKYLVIYVRFWMVLVLRVSTQYKRWPGYFLSSMFPALWEHILVHLPLLAPQNGALTGGANRDFHLSENTFADKDWKRPNIFLK